MASFSSFWQWSAILDIPGYTVNLDAFVLQDVFDDDLMSKECSSSWELYGLIAKSSEEAHFWGELESRADRLESSYVVESAKVDASRGLVSLDHVFLWP